MNPNQPPINPSQPGPPPEPQYGSPPQPQQPVAGADGGMFVGGSAPVVSPTSSQPPLPGQMGPPPLSPAPAMPGAPVASSYGAPYEPVPNEGKSYIVTFILSLIFGVLGLDRFYLGKIGTGVLKLITAGGLGIWSLIDWIMVLMGRTTDKQGRLLVGRERYFKLSVIILIVWCVIGGGVGAKLAAGKSGLISMSNYENKYNLVSLTGNADSDLENLTSDIEAQSASSFTTDCSQLNTDTQALAKLPTLPDSKANTDFEKLVSGLQTVVQTCQSGMPTSNQQVNAYNQDVNKINNAGNALNSRIDAINKAAGVSNSD